MINVTTLSDTPDGTYGPFNINCNLVVRDGVVSVEPVGSTVHDYLLVVSKNGADTHASLEALQMATAR